MSLYHLQEAQGPTSRSRATEASRNIVVAWQEDMAYKEIAIATTPHSDQIKAQWTKKARYIKPTNTPLPCSANTSNRPQKQPLPAPGASKAEADAQKANVGSKSARKVIDDVQPRTYRGGPNPPTTTPQRVGGVPMMRNSVPMARAGHSRDQDLPGVGLQFEADVLVNEFFELEGWVFV